MIPYIMLGFAIATEVAGDAMLKLSNGLERKLPLVAALIGYAVAFFLEGLVLEFLPLGFTYAVWAGAGVALTAIVGAIFWHEGMNAKKILGIVAIVVGVVVLKAGV